MPYGLTDEQRELARTTRTLLADRASPLPPAWDATGAGIDRALWRSLADLGLLGLGVPDDLGGSGGGARELCLVAERAGEALPRIPYTGTATVLSLMPAESASITNGETIAVPAWETFPAAARRKHSLRLARSTVDGRLGAVSFGLDADLLLAFAGEIPLLVDLGHSGVRRTAVTSFDVTEPMAAIELTGVPVTLLAPVTSWALVHAVLAAELIGTGQRALDTAVEYAKQRRQFGRPIGSFQAIKHMLADLFVQLEAARLLVDWAATAIDEGRPDCAAAAETALVAAGHAADAATADALQAHGGIGFTWDHTSHVFLKRARARRSLLGSPARQLDRLADHVFTPPH